MHLAPISPPRLVLRFEPDELAAFARYKRFLLDWKFIEHDFSLDDWLAPAHLTAAAAKDRTGTR